MNNNMKVHLTGGILFSYLCTIKKIKFIKSQYMNPYIDKTGDITDTLLLKYLIRIICEHPSDEKSESTLKTNTSLFKSCDPALKSKWLDFNGLIYDDYKTNFEKKGYLYYLKRANEFIKVCLDYEHDFKYKKVAKILLQLIITDDAIDNDAFFFINADGSGLKKSDITPDKPFYFQSLILGIFLYIISNKVKNSYGEEGYNTLFRNIGGTFVALDLQSNAFVNTNIDLISDKSPYLQMVIDLEEKTVNQTVSIPLSSVNSNTTTYLKYLEKFERNNRNIKTILFTDQDVDFYKVFICSHVQNQTTKMGEKKPEQTIQATPKKIIDLYGHFITITAPGGIGKSMFLKHLSLCELAFKEHPEMIKTGLIPILLKLKNYNKSSLFDFIYSQINKLDKSISIECFTDDLNSGKFLILLDAYDELNKIQSTTFSNDLANFCETYPNNYFIISSRPNLAVESLQKFINLELLPLTYQQGIKLINHFKDYGNDIVESFCKHLSKNDFTRTASIINNPLLLTLKFLIYVESGEFHKGNTPDFYREAYEVLYSKHDQINNNYQREFATKLNVDEMASFLRILAYKTFISFKTSFSHNDIENIIDDNNFEQYPLLTTRNIINDLCNNMSLIYKENGKYSFIHRSFQEYFAAEYISKQKSSFFNNAFINMLENFTTKKRKSKGENTTLLFMFNQSFGLLDMLQGINKKKYQKFIILPALNKIFNFDFTSKDENIIKYLINVFGSISISFGSTEHNGPYSMNFKSEIIEYIYNQNDIDIYEYKFCNTTPHEELIQTEYYFIDVDENGIPNFTTDPDDVREPDGTYRERDGFDMLVDLDSLIDEKNKYSDIIEDIMFNFDNEYNILYLLWKQLKEEYN